MSEIHPVDAFIGKRLWLRRKLLGLSQSALASGVGITFQQVQKYERGVNRISVSRLYDFARALDVPVAFFFEGLEATNDNFAVEDAGRTHAAEGRAMFGAEEMITPETLDLLRSYNALTPAVRKKVVEMVKALSSDSLLLTKKTPLA